MIHRQWFLSAIGDESALQQKAQTLLLENDISSDEHALKLLAKLTASDGTNLATSVYYQYLQAHPIHGQFIQQVNDAERAPDNTSLLPHLIVVPGMFAKEKPEIGGDGALIVELASALGFSVSTAPTDGRESIAKNASTLHDYLLHRQDSKFWLVSMSRGSSDVKFMLNHYCDAPYLDRLSQWISISGIVTGSPLANRFSNKTVNSVILRALTKISGVSSALPNELDCQHGFWHQPVKNKTFGITYITPVPLDWHVSSAVIPRYKRLQKLGPTDGITLLCDLLTQPGRIYPIWGADHLLRVPNLADHLYSVISFLRNE